MVVQINLDSLMDFIRGVGRPVALRPLTREVLQSALASAAPEIHYAPGAAYTVGARLLLDGQHVEVAAVQEGHNPAQGTFNVLILRLPDGNQRRMAAGVAGAPLAPPPEPSRMPLESMNPQEEAILHQQLRETLSADDRFLNCETSQGELWCLDEMLPSISPEERRQALSLIPSALINGALVSRTTEELSQALWGIGDDGSDDVALLAFALARMLQRETEIFYDHHGWLSRAAWDAYTERPVLTSPRLTSLVELPPGVVLIQETDRSGQNESEAIPLGLEESDGMQEAEDLDTWREKRLQQAVLTLHARHYYEGWFPLRGRVRRLFPPSDKPQQIILAHHFGDEREVFSCWVDAGSSRIVLSPEIYDTFREHHIYPGARLRLTAISEREYELSTRPATQDTPIRVSRMWRNDAGVIEYDEVDEPRQYDIDDAVFIADVRFEDMAALWQQAQEAGNSIFGLMYAEAVRRWEANGRQELLVTTDDLFTTIHNSPEGRMTSRATVAVELWQRRAFEPVGGGRYRFRPGYGEQRRGSSNRARITSKQAPDTPSEMAESYVWEQVRQLIGRTLYTLKQRNPFRVEGIKGTVVQITIGKTGHSRPVRRSEILLAWQKLERDSEISFADVQENALFNPAYVSAILAQFPGVTYWTRPIRLRYQPAIKPVPEGVDAPIETISPEAAHADVVSDQDEFVQMRHLIEDRLVGHVIETLAQRKLNHIVAASADGLLVRTAHGSGTVPWEWIESAYTVLRNRGEHGSLEPRELQRGVQRTRGGYRGAFIFALLAQFTHIEVHLKPRRRLVYHAPRGSVTLRSRFESAITPAPIERIAEPASAGTSPLPTGLEPEPILPDMSDSLPPELISTADDSPAMRLLAAVEQPALEACRWLDQFHTYLRSHLGAIEPLAADEMDSQEDLAMLLSNLPLHDIAVAARAGERSQLSAEGYDFAAAWVQQSHAEATPYRDFLTSSMGRWLSGRLSETDAEESGAVCDLLAALAEDMLALNREIRIEMLDFLNWLERQIGARVGDLAGKTNLQDYLGDYQTGQLHLVMEELLTILRKNRRVLKVDPDNRRFQDLLAPEYDESLEKLLPLKHRLAATDRLIALIVYRVHGLTEAEVVIAEHTDGTRVDS